MILVGDMPWDELVCLAKENPTKFEEIRTQLIGDCISKATPRNRENLKLLQVELDNAMDAQTEPDGRLLVIGSMLLQSLTREMALLENLMFRLVPGWKEEQSDSQEKVIHLGNKRK